MTAMQADPTATSSTCYEKASEVSAQIILVSDLSETASGESITDKIQVLQVEQIE